jgi:hypothetical protein
MPVDGLTTPEQSKLFAGPATDEIDALLDAVRGMALIAERGYLDAHDPSPVCQDDAQWTAIRELVERVDRLCIAWAKAY